MERDTASRSLALLEILEDDFDPFVPKHCPIKRGTSIENPVIDSKLQEGDGFEDITCTGDSFRETLIPTCLECEIGPVG